MNIQNFDIVLNDPDDFVSDYEKNIKVQYEVIAPQPGGQTDFLSRREFEVFFGGCLTLDTKILTPDGYKPITEIKIGDYVSIPDGNFAKIIDIPFEGLEDTYSVEFSDGTIIKASAGHKWAVYDGNNHKQKKYKIKRTIELLDNYKLLENKYRYSVPIYKPSKWFDDDKPVKMITGINYIGKEIVKGITVDTPDHLLIADNFTITSNSAGPGKSWALVLDALGIQFQYEQFGMPAYQHPRYRAILFRRNSTRLQNLIDEAKRIYDGLGAIFTLQRKGEPGSSFTFPSGAKIFLSHLEQDADVDNHQGMEYQYVGFDELCQFTLKQYLYLMSRLRGVVMNNGVGLDKRIRGTGNPIGEGLWWVKKRFIQSNNFTMIPGKTYFFISDPSCEPEENPTGIRVFPNDPRFIHAKSRTFIPGFLYENKILMESDPNYASSIMQLGAKMEKALLHGDWDALKGDFFDMFDKQESEEEPFDIPDNWQLIGGVDPGWSNPTAFHLIAREPDGIAHLLFTFNRAKSDPETNAKSIYSMIKNFPYTKGRMPSTIVAGQDAFAKKDRYGTKQTELTYADVFQNNGLYLQPAVNDRIIGWWVVKQYFASKKFKYFKGFADTCINEIVSIQADEDNPDEVKGYKAGSTPYHNADALRYGLMALPIPFSKHQKFLPVDFDYDKKKKVGKSKTTIMSE